MWYFFSSFACNSPSLIAVADNGGNGSEINRAALLTVANERKLGFGSNYLLPTAVICYPALTLSMPPLLKAQQELMHFLIVLKLSAVAVSDAIAPDGFERGYKNIIKATIDGTDRERREEMMMCSLQVV